MIASVKYLPPLRMARWPLLLSRTCALARTVNAVGSTAPAAASPASPPARQGRPSAPHLDHARRPVGVADLRRHFGRGVRRLDVHDEDARRPRPAATVLAASP